MKNNCNKITALYGDASTPRLKRFDIVIANINRNIILNDLSLYVQNFVTGGDLLLSGFYEKDLPMIKVAANKSNLSLIKPTVKNDWCCAYFKKNEK